MVNAEEVPDDRGLHIAKGYSEKLHDCRIAGCTLQKSNYSMSGYYDLKHIQFGTSAPHHAVAPMDQFQNKAMDQSPCGEGGETVVCQVWEERAA